MDDELPEGWTKEASATRLRARKNVDAEQRGKLASKASIITGIALRLLFCIGVIISLAITAGEARDPDMGALIGVIGFFGFFFMCRSMKFRQLFRSLDNDAGRDKGVK